MSGRAVRFGVPIIFVQQTGVGSTELHSICSTVENMNKVFVHYPSPKSLTKDVKVLKYVYDEKISLSSRCNLINKLATFPSTSCPRCWQRLFLTFSVIVATRLKAYPVSFWTVTWNSATSAAEIRCNENFLDFRDICLNRIAEKVKHRLSSCVPVWEKYGA